MKKRMMSMLLCTAMAAGLLMGCGSKPAETTAAATEAATTAATEAAATEAATEAAAAAATEAVAAAAEALPPPTLRRWQTLRTPAPHRR